MTRLAITLILVVMVLGWSLQPVIGANFAQIVFVRAQAHLTALDNPLERSDIVSPFAKTSLRQRSERALAALSVWSQYPIMGVGLNNFGQYYPPDVDPKVHSGLIQALAEMGLLGLVGLGTLLALALLQMRNAVRRVRNDPVKWAILTAFYYTVWAMAFDLTLAGNWVSTTHWLTLSLGILAVHWSLSSQSQGAKNTVPTRSAQLGRAT